MLNSTEMLPANITKRVINAGEKRKLYFILLLLLFSR